jgi:hypothetical protein
MECGIDVTVCFARSPWHGWMSEADDDVGGGDAGDGTTT